MVYKKWDRLLHKQNHPGDLMVRGGFDWPILI